VTKRFHIDDLIIQDESGVVFRAQDTETGMTVAVRRFFPFGSEGGGLDRDEQTAYNIAISRLAGLSHPGMRSVICGGSDPIDRVPFIVTEWVDGESLASILERQSLAPETAIELLTIVLEVCELLSNVLAEEAVWVETDLRTIMAGDEAGGRPFTLWVCPLKWLNSGEVLRGLEPVDNLTEDIMGWRGKIVSDQAGRGLGGWLKWLRGVAETTTLQEAREMLAASTGKEPPAPVRQLVNQATITVPKKPRPAPKSKFPLTVGVLLIAIGAMGWLMHQRKNAAARAQLAAVGIEAPTPKLPPTASDRASLRAAELSVGLQAQQTAASQPGQVFSPDQQDLLVLREGQETTVEGRLEVIRVSSSGKTMYLQFSKGADKNQTCGAVPTEGAPADLSVNELKPLLGKLVRLKGTLKTQRLGGLKRPEILITNRASITVVEE
jgi:hypothetical protein